MSNRRYYIRLLLALSLSAGCFYASVYWYRTTEEKSTDQNSGQAIARLERVIQEVQRKPLTRVIWEKIDQGESLYAGEAVRTTSGSSARIIFAASGTVIDLEPESLIVVELNALDFLRGNMLVKSSGGSGLTLKTGQGSIELSQTDLALNRADSGDIQMDVLKGTAKLAADGKVTELDPSKSASLNEKSGLQIGASRIKVIQPEPGQRLMLKTQSREALEIQWEKLPEAYQVFLETGPARNRLERRESVKATGASGKLKYPLPAGRQFFRLLAADPNGQLPEISSAILPVEVLAKLPPTLLEPEKQADVIPSSENMKTRFRWVNRLEYEKIAVEIARDPGFRDLVSREFIEAHAETFEASLPANGSYHWRVTGYLKGEPDALASPVWNFRFRKSIDLVPPKLRSPVPRQSLIYEQVLENGVNFSFEAVAGLSLYRLHIEQRTGDPKGPTEYSPLPALEVRKSPHQVSQLKPGWYRWKMVSVDDKGKLSEASDWREFSIEEMSEIQWADGSTDSEFFYFTKEPSLSAAWQKGPSGVLSWKYRIGQKDQLNAESPWRDSDRNLLVTTLPSDGTYEIEVEGLDGRGRTIARSRKKFVKVQAMPLLPAPQLAAELPTPLTADRQGDVKLNWKPVPGAKEYSVSVQPAGQGGEVKEIRVSRELASFTRLKPGKYQVQLRSIDQHARPGPLGEQRELVVPDGSSIQAPKLKSLKVK